MMSRTAQRVSRRRTPRTSKRAWQSFFPAKPATTSQTDSVEAEADLAAGQVMKSDTSSVHNAFFAPAPVSIHKKCKGCGENEMTQGLKEIAGRTPDTGTVASFFSQSPAGIPLPESSRKFFGSRFGYDFSSVRIHHDHRASVSAESVDALAYTVGNNIVFNKNQFSPETSEGKKLLAHELTHVIQQSHAPASIQRKCRVEEGKIIAINIPADGRYLKAEPRDDADNFPGDLLANGDKVVVKNTGGAATYRSVRNCLWAWIEVPGKNSPDKNYPVLHGFIPTEFLEREPQKTEEDGGKKKGDNDGKGQGDDGGKKKNDDGQKTVKKEAPADTKPEQGINECDDATFCTPYADISLAEAVKQLCKENLEDYVFVFLISEAENLWRDYLKRKPGDDMTPKEFKSPDSPLAEKFGEDSLTLEHQEKILENIVAKSHDQAIEVFADRPIFYRVELLADASLLNTPLEFDDVLFSPNTALTAGGAGGHDRRAVSGTIAIEPSAKNDVTGEQNWRVFTKLTLWVKDTIDFCPGKCGSVIEKLTLTLPLSRLEATGLVYDVPFEIFADITPVQYDYLESDLKVKVRESP